MNNTSNPYLQTDFNEKESSMNLSRNLSSTKQVSLFKIKPFSLILNPGMKLLRLWNSLKRTTA